MINFQTKNLFKDKKILLTLTFILICLFLVIVFPVGGSFEGLTKSLFFFFVIPIFFIKIVLNEKINNYGLNLKNKQAGLIWGSIMLLVSLATAYLFINYTDFSKNSNLPIAVINNFWFFIIYIIIFSGTIFFFQEFFFRGFIISFLKKYLGAWSVFIQFMLYFLIILIGSGGFNREIWEFIPYLVISITGGITAYKSNSMVYSWISGILFLIIANSYIIYTIKIQ